MYTGSQYNELTVLPIPKVEAFLILNNRQNKASNYASDSSTAPQLSFLYITSLVEKSILV
jgi:hypothetical protein